MGIAHINRSGKIQTVSEHSSGVKKKAAEYAEKINACRIAELAGLIHDTGKLCNDFEKYIKHENSIKRGDIDHERNELFRKSGNNSPQHKYVPRTPLCQDKRDS